MSEWAPGNQNWPRFTPVGAVARDRIVAHLRPAAGRSDAPMIADTGGCELLEFGAGSREGPTARLRLAECRMDARGGDFAVLHRVHHFGPLAHAIAAREELGDAGGAGRLVHQDAPALNLQTRHG